MNRRPARALLALYVAGLLLLTLAPLPETAGRLAAAPGFDKAAHFVLLGGLAAVLYWNVLRPAPARPPAPGPVLWPSAALAAVIELVQALLPYRTGDFWDFYCGALGALAAYVGSRRLTRR